MQDIIEYFKKRTGFKPTPEQVELLNFLVDNSIKNGMVSCGRGFSKTLCSAIAFLWYAEKSLEEYPLNLMIVSPQDTMYSYVNDYFNSPALLENRIKKGVYTEVPVEGFELKNGTKAFTKPATGKVRSNRADILFIDEAADVPEAVIKSAMQCLRGSINRLILVSTPHKKGYFNDRALEPEKFGYQMKRFSSETCPWLTQTIERDKHELSKAEYAIEVEGRPPTKKERSFFSSPHITSCTHPEILKNGGPKSKIEIGIDFAFSPCATALMVIERLGVKTRILYLKQWKKTSREIMVPEIEKLCEKWGPDVIKADSMPLEYKQFFTANSTLKIEWVSSRVYKTEMLTQLQRKIREHNLEIPENRKDLIMQLRRYRLGETTRNDDLVDALAFANLELPKFEKKKGFFEPIVGNF